MQNGIHAPAKCVCVCVCVCVRARARILICWLRLHLFRPPCHTTISARQLGCPLLFRQRRRARLHLTEVDATPITVAGNWLLSYSSPIHALLLSMFASLEC